MIEYPIDLKLPYRILDVNGDRLTVEGVSKIIQVNVNGESAEFGGVPGIWDNIRKDMLLTNVQKACIKRMEHYVSKRTAERLRNEFCASVIAEHSNGHKW